jgi:flagellar motility protein MotE (MotC chaperone)
MLKTIITVLGVILLVHTLALAGLLGYGLATGRFEADARAQYLATWKGEKLGPITEEVVVDEAKESPQEAATRISEAEVAREVRSLEIQRQMERLRNMRSAVEGAQGNLDKKVSELKVAKDEFENDLLEQNTSARAEGFGKNLEMYSGMKAKDVLKDFMKMPDEKVARYLVAMPPNKVKKILTQFKSAQEQDKRLRVMSLIENLNTLENGAG